MAFLINAAAGVAANDNTTPNTVYFNRDPVFVDNNLMTSVYFSADVWGGASVQVFISPQVANSQYPVQWFPIGSPLTENGVFTFQARWGQIKAMVTGATVDTANLNCIVFDGL